MRNTDHPVPSTSLDPLDALDGIGAAPDGCCRYDAERDNPADRCVDCSEPAEATLTLTTTQVADLAELLGEIDEFLRMGEHAIDALTEFYRTRHDDQHPRFVALCLLDSISFTALCLRQQAQAARDNHGADR